ncbi:TetR/AcrR family transcriptional regulator [Sulfurospirillum sp. 1307]
MNKKNLANRINVSLATLYNWEKTKPELIKLIEKGLKFEKGINIENNSINEYFYKLDEKEQEMYISEIKARVLRKEIDKK